QVVALNRLHTSAVYVQITRGSAPRAHAFPKEVSPSLIVSVKRAPFSIEKGLPSAGSILTMLDERWGRPDIKSICLLPNALAKQAATEAGAFEAVLYRKDGIVTEGSSSNIWLIQSDNQIITPPANGYILNGITRQVILELCRANGIQASEQTFTRDDLKNAKEIFLSGTTTFIKPINKVDNHLLLETGMFPVSTRIAMLYRQFCVDHKQDALFKVSNPLKMCS
ncbi:MAG: aminotransferase class IV, partial [Alphaproteobacteria bacterium]|nr:aminotransferase class IV [Alphaproteobacteria bacterium]